jgi:hypothetical protein
MAKAWKKGRGQLGAEGGFFFAVESKTKRGWKRFLEHHYRAARGWGRGTGWVVTSFRTDCPEESRRNSAEATPGGSMLRTM